MAYHHINDSEGDHSKNLPRGQQRPTSHVEQLTELDNQVKEDWGRRVGTGGGT